MISPSKAEFDELRTKEGIITVSIELNADELTPISIFYSMKGKNKFLLESAESGKSWGRYSFLGSDPYMIIKSNKGEILKQAGNKIEVKKGRVLDEIKHHMQKYTVLNDNDISLLRGGCVGYVGYDVVRQYENIPDNNEDIMGTPDACLMFYKVIISYDHFYHKVKIMYNVMPEDDVTYSDVLYYLDECKNMITQNKLHQLDNKSHLKNINVLCNEEKYGDMVEKAKKHIKDGDIFQVVLSQQVVAETDIDPFDAYRKLRTLNPSPYLFYIDFGDFQIVGSSPESLVSVHGGIVRTNPIAGTRPRGVNEEEDERLKNELLSDEKERAEHIMLVDLGRNDIGKVSKFGSVKVEKFMDVEMYSHVMHIVSTVSGELTDGNTCFESLISCLPAGTVSGAPKVRAMEIIDDLENERRGIYAGAVGYFDFSGNMDMCIAIRTIIFKGGKAYIRSGAGIVYDSVKENEYKETLNKAMALKEVL